MLASLKKFTVTGYAYWLYKLTQGKTVYKQASKGRRKERNIWMDCRELIGLKEQNLRKFWHSRMQVVIYSGLLVLYTVLCNAFLGTKVAKYYLRVGRLKCCSVKTWIIRKTKSIFYFSSVFWLIYEFSHHQKSDCLRS